MNKYAPESDLYPQVRLQDYLKAMIVHIDKYVEKYMQILILNKFNIFAAIVCYDIRGG